MDQQDNNMDPQPPAIQPTSGLGNMPREIKDLMQQLKSDRLIQIFIGDENEPFLVQEGLLTNASEYFAKALKHELSLGSELGVLRFPEDGPVLQAWGTKHLVLCVHAWVLGDKYLMPRFQNAVMMEFITHFREGYLPDSKSLVNTLLRLSPAGSEIRRIIAEEVIFIMYGDQAARIKSSDLTAADEGGSGIAASLLDAFEAYKEKDGVLLRWDVAFRVDYSSLREYLVVDGVSRLEEPSDDEMSDESKESDDDSS
ncbi:hypothetical protein M409DRAFT_25038 [Zasmidium cellare ATCC 36951]|uniref:BTB domain-containing protein n=1 Tax=Zasmidium cellare ATCC 36951 TaxID=1080233 RepID=A0A6A6CBU7_ZASCE|nr:uncharacterized protein M409DRAFT_25038 [Zasmidium cellare ATCC 36951]KAF2164644.1 hypothetical protein M409DRAFT_25038 [Zasmidium cellare ATCC 36951]